MSLSLWFFVLTSVFARSFRQGARTVVRKGAFAELLDTIVVEVVRVERDVSGDHVSIASFHPMARVLRG